MEGEGERERRRGREGGRERGPCYSTPPFPPGPARTDRLRGHTLGPAVSFCRPLSCLTACPPTRRRLFTQPSQPRRLERQGGSGWRRGCLPACLPARAHTHTHRPTPRAQGPPSQQTCRTASVPSPRQRPLLLPTLTILFHASDSILSRLGLVWTGFALALSASCDSWLCVIPRLAPWLPSSCASVSRVSTAVLSHQLPASVSLVRLLVSRRGGG